MSHNQYILAHDLGTTGDKATLFEAGTGRAVAAVRQSYDTFYPQPNWAEQDAAGWQRAVYDGTRRLLEQADVSPADLAVVSFSGMMNGALPVDAEGEPLGPAIIWADQRATAEAEFLAHCCGAGEVYRRTGHRAGAAYTAAKMLWLQRHRPALYAATHLFLQAKDYAASLLTGVCATDYSDASSTNLFDLERREWAADIVGAVGLDVNKLPPAYPSSAVIGGVTRSAAAQTGLLAGTPVVIGAGDGGSATVGAGSVLPGDAYNNLGSSSWIAATTERPLYDPQMRTFTYVHPDARLYLPCGTMQCAGGSYDWLEGVLRGEAATDLHEVLAAQAARVAPGAAGLLFLPHLMGERSPYWNPQARGAFVGLTMAHGRPELARAVLEGVAFTLKMILEAFQAQGTGVTAMRLIGGGARSALWRQILADIYGMPILRPALLSEASALGAAICGGVGVGLYTDFGVAHSLVTADDAELPEPTAGQRYAELYPLFQEAYRALEPIFGRLS